MNTKQEYRDVSKKVLETLQLDRDVMPEGMAKWDWPTGVALYGVWKSYLESGDRAEFDYLRGWFDHMLAQPAPHRNVNSVAPLLTLACLYEKTGDERYGDAVRDWANWVMHDMPRTEYGGLQHCTIWNRHYQQLWCDTLFMACLFLCKAGLVLGKEEYVEEAKFQFLIHIRYLQDTVSGLWTHGWTFDCRHSFASAHWARGNAWFTAASVDLIDMLPRRDAATRFITIALQDQVLALWKYQRENGLFTTLIDVEETYCETSAAAGIAYGVLKGVRMGILDKKYQEMGEKAASAVIAKIDEKGVVQGVSGGTGMGHTIQHYKDIAVMPTPYGQGLTYLMLTELAIEATR